ncbi:MAG: DUF4388 domain-containing protein [Cyanobacteria bacterium SZAS LIN-3]|nr:DUF4388 domain-containing protein [Cyanobacteria bacterium SZAS LIN-3]
MPRQTLAPGLKELQTLCDQARENRGREVELTWQVPHASKAYSIHVKFDRVTPQPLWNIWENNGKEAKLVWRFETADVNMIYDVVAMLEVQHAPGTGSQTLSQQVPPGGGHSGTFQTVQANLGSAISGTFSTQNPNAGQTGANPTYVRPQPSPAIQPSFQPPPDPPATAQSPTANWRNVEQGSVSGSWAQDLLNQPAGQPLTQPNTARPAAPQPQMQKPMGQANFAQQPNSAFNQSQTQGRGLGAISASSLPEGSLPADFFSDAPATMAAPPSKSTNNIEGTIEQNPMNTVLTSIGMQQLTGKLEIIGDAAVGHVYFENGIPKDAQTSGSRGDDAIKELVTWRRGTFIFKSGVRTEMSSVEKSLQTSVQEGIALLDQLKHLEKSGLVYESILTQKQKNLGDPELKLMLAKGVPLDFSTQKEVYESLKHKKTFTDLLRDRPMEQAQWAPLLFNLLYCGLIEIKAPTTTRGGALDFLGEGKQIIQNLAYNFIKPETGLMSWEALLYFMEYEYYRYEAYSWPLSLVVFEMDLRRGGQMAEHEALPPQALNTAAMRIGLVKRPLDLLGHFENKDFAILMPNTRASQAAFVANRILDSLTVTPLAPGIDRANLSLCFGVANLPSDGEDLESLVRSAASAKMEASTGTFPIVLARTGKRD